eukprot:5503174-Amphidinium_carterae.1
MSISIVERMKGFASASCFPLKESLKGVIKAKSPAKWLVLMFSWIDHVCRGSTCSAVTAEFYFGFRPRPVSAELS